MNEFLSDENIALHREYIITKKLKYSILESSIEKLRGANVKDIFRMKLDARDRRDALLLLPEIRLHDVYFSSFSKTRFSHSALITESYGNEAAFLNEVYRICMSIRYGFVCIFLVGGRVAVQGFEGFEDVFRFADPLLAVDVCEHAYFMDYGFDKERYLICALPYLDITKITVAD